MKKLLICLLLFSNMSNAARLDCGMANIQRLYVQGEREDEFLHQNSLIVILASDKSQACSDVNFAMMKNDKPAYNSVLSMLLSSYTTKSQIRVVVNSNDLGAKTHNIEWVNFQ